MTCVLIHNPHYHSSTPSIINSTAVFESSGRVTGLLAGQTVSVLLRLRLTSFLLFWPAQGRQALLALPPGYAAQLRRSDGAGLATCTAASASTQSIGMEAAVLGGAGGGSVTLLIVS